MEYEIYVCSVLTDQALKDKLTHITRAAFDEEIKPDVYTRIGYEVYFRGQFVSFSFSTPDEEDAMLIESTSKAFDVSTNKKIVVNLYTKTIEPGSKLMIKGIGLLLKEFPGDMLVIDHQSSPVMKRVGDNVTVSSYMFSHNGYITDEVLALLNTSYKIGSIEEK